MYLGSIASKFDLTSAEIMKLNPGITDSTVLQIGQDFKCDSLKTTY